MLQEARMDSAGPNPQDSQTLNQGTASTPAPAEGQSVMQTAVDETLPPPPLPSASEQTTEVAIVPPSALYVAPTLPLLPTPPEQPPASLPQGVATGSILI